MCLSIWAAKMALLTCGERLEFSSRAGTPVGGGKASSTNDSEKVITSRGRAKEWVMHVPNHASQQSCEDSTAGQVTEAKPESAADCVMSRWATCAQLT